MTALRWGLLFTLCLLTPRVWAGSYALTDLTYGLSSERVTAVAVYPRDGKTALAGVDGTVFKTDDGGQSWRVVLSFRYGLAGDSRPVESTDKLDLDELDVDGEPIDDEFAGRNQGDYADSDTDTTDSVDRTDEGQTSASATERGNSAGLMGAGAASLPKGSVEEDRPVFARTLPGVRALRFAPADPNIVYAATPMGLFRSTDRGESFVPVDLPKQTAARDVRDVAIHPSIPTYLLIATRAGGFDSRDGGASWQALPGRAGRIPALSAAILDNPQRSILLGSTEGLFRSDDGGANYLLQLLAEGGRDQPVSSIAFDSAREVIAVGTGRGLYTAHSNESIYLPFDLGHRDQIERVVFSPLPGGPLFAAAMFGLYRLDLNRGDVDNLLADGDVHGALDVSPDGRKRQEIWVATNQGLFRRMRGGGSDGIALQQNRMDELLQREPTLDEVVEAARRFAGYSRADIKGAIDRAAQAAALPQVEFSYRQLIVRDEGIGWGLGGTQGLEALDELADFYGDIYNQEPLYVRSRNASLALLTLRWNLDDLVLHSQSTKLSREHSRNNKFELKLIHRVIKAYNSRHRSLRQVVVRRSRDKRVEVKHLLRLLEYTAKLDALTGGFFSKQARVRGAEAIIGVSYDGSPMPAAKPLAQPTTAPNKTSQSDAQASTTRG